MFIANEQTKIMNNKIKQTIMKTIKKAAEIAYPTISVYNDFDVEHNNRISEQQNAFITGAISNEAYLFHTKGMYSYEEVRLLFEAIKATQEFAKQFNLPCDIVEQFEENKKK